MSGDGAIVESDVVEMLRLLLIRQHVAQQTPTRRTKEFIDVVSLSMGYYHEQPDDLTFDPVLLKPLRALSRTGAAVVVAAGNDATSRPMFPAAFAPHKGGTIRQFARDEVPLISVGARNPNNTIALFSNAGDWVLCYRPGAALVSTFPTSFDASEQPTHRVYDPRAGWRETLDMDNFHAGFGTWSGTSFAAPVLAGELAQRIVDGRGGVVDPIDRTNAIARTWGAISLELQVSRP